MELVVLLCPKPNAGHDKRDENDEDDYRYPDDQTDATILFNVVTLRKLNVTFEKSEIVTPMTLTTIITITTTNFSEEFIFNVWSKSTKFKLNTGQKF